MVFHKSILCIILLLLVTIKDTNSSWVSYNCGANGGQTPVTGGAYRLAALNSPWSAAHFCQMIKSDVILTSHNYEVSLDMYSVHSGPTCHTGMAFNWVDQNNYDFFYIRTHSTSCMAYGHVSGGSIASITNAPTCSSAITSALSDQVWFTLKLVVKNGKARVYYGNVQIGPEWTTTKTGSKVGAAVANGYSDYVDYRNFIIDQDWESYNCGSNGGITQVTGGVYRLAALNSLWNAAHFCQMIKSDVTLTSTDYEVSLDMYSVHSGPTCHTGMAFNWVDQNNYDFFYIRTHSSSCMVYGHVSGGSIASITNAPTCSATITSALSDQVWFTLKLIVKSGKARVYYGNTQIGPEWTTTKNGNKVGAAVANGYTDYVDYRDFKLDEGWFSQNCGSNGGINKVTGNVYRLAALNSPWRSAHFCQMIKSDVTITPNNYEVSLDMYSVHSGPTCHTGMAFNWVDQNNYDFFYIRTHSTSCMVYGHVSGGSIASITNSPTCSTTITSALSDQVWFTLKLVVKNGKARVYYSNTQIGPEWTTNKNGNKVGAAVANGYSDYVDFRNFMFDQGWLSYNCGSNGGITQVTGGVYRLAALNSPWNAAHFCQMMKSDVTLTSTDYEVSLDMYSVHSGPHCHTGMAFNWVDENNYDFFYIRTHSSSCMVYGHVSGGAVASITKAPTCSTTITSALSDQVWFTLKLVVNDGKASVYYGNTQIGPEWTTNKTGNKVGAAVANGYSDYVDYRNFDLIYDTSVIVSP